MQARKARVWQPSHEAFFLIAVIVVSFSMWALVQGYILLLAGPVFLNLLPVDGTTYTIGDTVTFSGSFSGGVAPYTVKLYVSTEESIGREDPVYTRSNVADGRTVSYAWNSSDKREGRYYWYFLVIDSRGGEYQSETHSFPLLAPSETHPSDRVEDNPSPTSARPGNSAPGGKGGAVASSTGEKTGFFFPLNSGQSTLLTFNQRVKIHRIHSLTIFALDPLPGGNTFLIHQELEPYFHSHEEEGLGDGLDEHAGVIKHAFFKALPPDMAAFKAIHIHTTQSWSSLDFLSRVEFEVPKSWLEKHGLKKENVFIQVVDTTTLSWKWVAVSEVAETGDAVVYRVTFNGLPPFVIGGSKDSYYGGKITPGN